MNFSKLGAWVNIYVQLIALIIVAVSLYQVVAGIWCSPKIWATIAVGMYVQITAMRRVQKGFLNAEVGEATLLKRCSISVLALTSLACISALLTTALGMNRIAPYCT